MNLPDFLSEDKYGFIHLTGHRVGLIHIVDRYNDSKSAEALQELLPTVELPLIHKVLAFYLENRSEVDAYIARCHAEIDKQAQGPRRGPDHAELRRRMEAKQRSESA